MSEENRRADLPNLKRDLPAPLDERPAAAWIWMLLGFGVTLLSAFIAFGIIDTFLSREPLQFESEVGAADSQPTIIRLTAPATETPSPTAEKSTPTPIPTLTASPTPDRLIAPAEISIGFFAKVVATDGFGVNIRLGPGTSNELIEIAEEGAFVLVRDGPRNADGFTWWEIQLGTGQIGWAVQRFLEPAAQPLDWTVPANE